MIDFLSMIQTDFSKKKSGYPPTADPAYPPASAGGPIGFNVDPGYPATAQPFYQPNLGGGGGGGSSALYPPVN